MSAIDLSSYIGQAALFLLTGNILLGLLISVRYSPVKNWPHRKISIFAMHNWTGYTALCVATLHPVVLMFSRTAGFRWTDILWPLHSPTQPLVNSLGAAALYCLTLVVSRRTSGYNWAAAPGRRCTTPPMHQPRSSSRMEFLPTPSSRADLPTFLMERSWRWKDACSLFSSLWGGESATR